jgi:CDP-glucose 4,6-dehydratase
MLRHGRHGESDMVNPTLNFWNGRRVLVTGHSGFKGSWLTMWLNHMGAEVIGLSLDDRQSHELYCTARIDELCESISADIRDPRSWEQRLIEFKPEVAFHLAAQSLVRPSYDDPVSTFEINVTGTAKVLESLRRITQIRTVVVATTDKVYRDVENRQPFKESDHLGGHDPYSASKAACEMVISSYRKSFYDRLKISLSSGRAGNVIGGGDWAIDRLIPDAIRAWSAGKELVIRNPDFTRPWQHVLEPLLGYLVLAEKTFDTQDLVGSFNFGPLDNESLSVQEVIQVASHRFGDAAFRTETNESTKHESEWLNLDAGQARNCLGVEARLSSEQAVNWAVDWYKNELSGKPARELCLAQINAYLELAG